MNYFYSSVGCTFFRDYRSTAPYIVMLGIPGEFFATSWHGMPCARAVMDDFGSLIITERFK